MSAEATKSVIATCPHCKASTKVSGIPESKEAITCPKCKQSVPLKNAKVAKDRPVGGPSRAVSLPQPTAEDYKRAYNKKSLWKGRRGLWLGVTIGAGLGLLVAAIVLTLTWPNGTPQPGTGGSLHVQMLGELNQLYDQANKDMEAINTPQEVFAFNAAQESVTRRLAELNSRYSALAPASREDRDLVLQQENLLANNKRRYQEARSRLAKLVQGITVATAPSPSQAGNLPAASSSPGSAPNTPGSTLVITSTSPQPNGPVSTGSSPRATGVPDHERVTLTLLNLPKEKVTKEFLTQLQSLAGGRARILNTHWSGDLFVVELGPVSDLDRFAARLAFGQVTSLVKEQRSITLLVRTEAVGAGGTLPDLPKDPFEAALQDLRSTEPEKRRRGANELLQMKPNEYRAEAIEAILAALTDQDLTNRLLLLRALGRWSGNDSLEVFIRYLADESPQIRRTVLEILAQLRDPRAAEAIVQHNMVKDRDAASTTLQQLGLKAEPPVLPLLRQDNKELQLEACRILKKIGTKAAIPDLVKLTDEKAPVGPAAWDALEAIARRRE